MYFAILKMENKNKKKILKTLKNFKKLPTARLSAIIGINYNYIKSILEELEKDGLIECEKAGELATYWKLKENK